MFYEVQVPVAGGSALRTFQVDAPHWRAAWRAAATQLDGASPDEGGRLPGTGEFADLRGDRVVVTDPAARRMAWVRRVADDDVHRSQVLRVVSGIHAEPASARGRGVPSGPLTVKDAGTGRTHTVVSSSVRTPVADPGTGRVMAEAMEPSREARRAEARVSSASQDPLASVSETALEDVFLEIMTLFEPDFAMEQAIDFVLDLAMRHVPSEAGGVLFASDEGDHLYFAAARGDARPALERARLSVRDGIPAASLRDGVAIATAAAAADSRHTPELSRAAGIPIDSLCVAPVQCGPRAFGLLLLANRAQQPLYTRSDANIVAYIGAQMGRYIEDRLDEADGG